MLEANTKDKKELLNKNAFFSCWSNSSFSVWVNVSTAFCGSSCCSNAMLDKEQSFCCSGWWLQSEV